MTREPIKIIHGRSTNNFLERENGQPGGGWKMTATNWGIRIEKKISFRGEAVAVNRMIPWAGVKFADLHPESTAPVAKAGDK